MGTTSETLRRWVRQAQIDAGQATGVTSESAREIRGLKRKNAELERTVEILKAATRGCECSTSKHTAFVERAIAQAAALQGDPCQQSDSSLRRRV